MHADLENRVLAPYFSLSASSFSEISEMACSQEISSHLSSPFSPTRFMQWLMRLGW